MGCRQGGARDRKHARAHLDGNGLVVVVEAVQFADGFVGNVGVAKGAQGLERVVELLARRDPGSAAGHLLQLGHVLVVHRAVVVLGRKKRNQTGKADYEALEMSARPKQRLRCEFYQGESNAGRRVSTPK